MLVVLYLFISVVFQISNKLFDFIDLYYRRFIQIFYSLSLYAVKTIEQLSGKEEKKKMCYQHFPLGARLNKRFWNLNHYVFLICIFSQMCFSITEYSIMRAFGAKVL